MITTELRFHLAQQGIRGEKKFLETLTLILKKCPQITRESFETYLFSLHSQGRRNATINKYISIIKTYGRYMKWAWVEDLKRWKNQDVFTATLSDEEIELFLALPLPPETPIKRWKMWTMFFTIQAYTGMRNNEIATLIVNQVDFGTNNFNLLETKTVNRRVPIPKFILPKLHEYVSECDTLLFPSSRSFTSVSRDAWHQQFTRRITLLGIKRDNLHPYSLRHSWITAMIGEGVGLSQVMRIAGHKNITTTEKYTHLVNKDLQNVINQHPNLKKKDTTGTILREWEKFRTLLQELPNLNRTKISNVEKAILKCIE